MRVCFIGDSIVAGVGDEDALGWVGRVTRHAIRAGADVTVYNLGVRRDTSADIRARWLREVDVRLPQGVDHRLCFSFGANDCADDGTGAPRVEARRTLENAEAILSVAAARAPTLMIGPVPILDDATADSRIADLDAQLVALCKRLAVPYLPLFATLQSTTAWTEGAARGDGTHSDARGYAALADYVLSWDPLLSWLGVGDP